MNVVFSRMAKILRKFNKKAYTIEDVIKICQRERINIVAYPMDDNIQGYYQTDLKRVYRKKYIVLNEKLSKADLLDVLLHELAHHFLHVSRNSAHQTFYCRLERSNDFKQDAEADAVALVMRIPEAKLLELMDIPFDQIFEFTHSQLARRQQLKEIHGI